jgi:small subunit ribosomal protein S11
VESTPESVIVRFRRLQSEKSIVLFCKLTLTDESGATVMWSSAGSLGFTGNRKATPFAAAKVGEVIGEKASVVGVKEADVYIKGVGAGRESALRAFSGKGIQVLSIHDVTPVPHNGPRPCKPRRV